MSEPISRDYLHRYLNENSSEKFYIEFDEYFSSHLTHAAIALYFMKDSKSHFDSYMEMHHELLETPDGHMANLQEAKGNRQEAIIEGKDGERGKGINGLGATTVLHDHRRPRVGFEF